MSFSLYGPRPILVDSSYRNRRKFPNQADFVIPFTGKSDLSSVEDPILASYSVFSQVAGVVSAALPGVYPAPAYPAPFEDYYFSQVVINLVDNIPNLYVGQYLYIPGRGSQKIVALFPNTPVIGQATVFVEGQYLVLPVAGDDYYIRQFVPDPFYNGPPPFPGLAGVGALPTRDFILPGTAVPVNDYYKGMYLVPLSGPNVGFVRPIVSYDGTTLSGSVAAFPFPMAAGMAFEILKVLRNNETPWQYGGSIATESSFANYKITLCYLMLPNKEVFSGWGGTMEDYPYVTIKFQPVDGGSSFNSIQSNNPFTTGTTIMSHIQPERNGAKFIVNRGCCCDGAVVKLSPACDIRVTVYLPNGDILKYDPTMENYQFQPANPEYQISMFLQIQKVV